MRETMGWETTRDSQHLANLAERTPGMASRQSRISWPSSEPDSNGTVRIIPSFYLTSGQYSFVKWVAQQSDILEKDAIVGITDLVSNTIGFAVLLTIPTTI